MTVSCATDLLDLLGARHGLVCLVGAGGKRSTQFQLARRFSGRLGLANTAHAKLFPPDWAEFSVVTGETLVADVIARRASPRLLFAHPSPTPGRLAGVSLEELAAIRDAVPFDLLLVKADGARTRLLKVPAAHEPVLPEDVDTVIHLSAATALGEPLDDRIAHRPGRVADVCGLAEGQRVEPVHLARLLASPQGALKDVGDARVVPVINMVDDAGRHRLARAAATEALRLTERYDYVVLASMSRNEPVVDVVTR